MQVLMQKQTYNFPYNAQRGTYLNTLFAFGFVFLVEAILVALLANFLIPNLIVKVTVNILHLSFCVYIFTLLISPLRTQHQLTSNHVHVHLGRRLNVQIPRDKIKEVRAVRKSASQVRQGIAYYEAKKQRIVACFSDQGMVLLLFRQPLLLRIGLRKHLVSNLLLNVDERDKFIELLTGEEQTSSSIAATVL
jgi:hypothetical protein